MRQQPLTFKQARHHLQIYWFLLPCVLFIGTFMYYPVLNGIYHSFFSWNGGDIERPVGFSNYVELLTNNEKFWRAFLNAFILGAANIVKMAPSILVAVCLNRVRSEKMQFIYKVSFVVPMIVSNMVVILLWKAFYEPTSGVLNTILRDTGGMNVLIALSSFSKGISERLDLIRCINWLCDCFAGDNPVWRLVSSTSIGLQRNFDFLGLFTWFGNLFVAGQNPGWLGMPKFTYLAVILWGFPWVGSFGVLMYLACLQAIGKEIYEAAEVDGAGWFTKFRFIELPMILRQVRVMMVLVIMGSINDAGTIMVLCGINGGPGGVADVPALFMFREAFQAQRMGYACGLGVVLFLIILVMTKLNELLVKPAD